MEINSIARLTYRVKKHFPQLVWEKQQIVFPIHENLPQNFCFTPVILNVVQVDHQWFTWNF